MRLELERSNDAKVAAAPPDRPKEIVVLARAGSNGAAVGQYDFGGEQIVKREAMFAHEPAEPATEGEAGHAGDRDVAPGDGEAVGLEGVIHFTPVAPTLSTDGARRSVNRD